MTKSKEKELHAYIDIQRKIIIGLKNGLDNQLNNNRALFKALLNDSAALRIYREQALKNIEHVTSERFINDNGYEFDTVSGWKEKK